MKSVDVSVVIINYNTYKITSDCLTSVYKYTSDIKFEVVLVDNASVECDAQLFKTAFPELVLVKSNTNLGFAGGNNLGIQHAMGKYILLLNSDTILFENTIKYTFEKYSLLKNPGFVSIKNIYPDGKPQFTCVFLPSLKNLLFRVLFLTRLTNRMMPYSKLDSDFSPEAIFGSYLFFDRNLLNSFTGGKLNEIFFIYHEDLLWCWEARQAGFKNYFISGTSIIHIVGASADEAELKRKKDNIHARNFKVLEQKINGPVLYPLYSVLKRIVTWKTKMFNQGRNLL